MAYVVKDAAGVVVLETEDWDEAVNTMHAHGKGATRWTGEGILLATCQGRFDAYVAAERYQARGQPQNRLPALFSTALPRVGIC